MRLEKLDTETGNVRSGTCSRRGVYIDTQGHATVDVTWDDLIHRGPVSQRIEGLNRYKVILVK